MCGLFVCVKCACVLFVRVKCAWVFGQFICY